MPAKPKIETSNREWGFYGTAFLNGQLLDRQCEEAYSEVANEVATKFRMTPAEVVAFLDGKHGRHLADELVDGEGLKPLDGMPSWSPRSWPFAPPTIGPRSRPTAPSTAICGCWGSNRPCGWPISSTPISPTPSNTHAGTAAGC